MLKILASVGLLIAAVLPAAAETSVSGVTFKAPSHWETITPSSPMRAAQWRIAPAKKNEDAGEIVVFYFGPGQGGDAASNIQRWQRTMTAPQGGRIDGEVKERTVAGVKVTELTAYGTYAGGMSMSGVPPVPKNDYGLVGVVMERPTGNIFIRFTGPDALVKAQLKAFRQFIDTAKVAK